MVLLRASAPAGEAETYRAAAEVSGASIYLALTFLDAEQTAFTGRQLRTTWPAGQRAIEEAAGQLPSEKVLQPPVPIVLLRLRRL